MTTSGPTPLERFLNGIFPENPVYRQLLGMCPTLAVTAAMKPALTMVAATAFVLISANLVTSLIRGLLKPHLRILVFTLTIATFVTIADRLLAAFVYPMSQQLGPYVPLIIVNCMIICRCEVCASKQGPVTALADALGNSLGFLLALGSVATVREILGTGTWLGFAVLPESFPRFVLMIMPPGAFLTLGVLLAAITAVAAIRERRMKARQEAVRASPVTGVGEGR
jgi:electron transport complex protein RnfE